MKMAKTIIMFLIVSLLALSSAFAYTIQGRMDVNNVGQIQGLTCFTLAGETKGFSWWYMTKDANQNPSWNYAAHTTPGVSGNTVSLRSYAIDHLDPMGDYIEFMSYNTDGTYRAGNPNYLDKIPGASSNGISLNHSKIGAWKCVYGDNKDENLGEYVFKMKEDAQVENKVTVTYVEQSGEFVCDYDHAAHPINAYYVWKENANTNVGVNYPILRNQYVKYDNYYYCYVYNDADFDGVPEQNELFGSGFSYATAPNHNLYAYNASVYPIIIDGFNQSVSLGTMDQQKAQLISGVHIKVYDNNVLVREADSANNGWAQIKYTPTGLGSHTVNVELSKAGYVSTSFQKTYEVYQRNCTFEDVRVSNGTVNTDSFFRGDNIKLSFKVYCDYKKGYANGNDLSLNVNLDGGQKYPFTGGYNAASQRFEYNLKIPELTNSILTKYHPDTSIVSIAVVQQTQYHAGGQDERHVEIKNRPPQIVPADYSVFEGAEIRFRVDAFDEDRFDQQQGLVITPNGNLPFGATFSAGMFAWTPGYDVSSRIENKTIAIPFKVMDQEGDVGVGTVNIKVLDVPRKVEVTIVSPKGETYKLNQNINFKINVVNEDNLPVSYLWNFDDGNTKTSATGNETYTYTKYTKEYLEPVLAYSYNGRTDYARTNLKLLKPSCSINISEDTLYVYTNKSLDVNAKVTCNYDNINYEITWSFTDGTPAYKDDETISHTFTKAGKYAIIATLYVPSSADAPVSDKVDVNVNDEVVVIPNKVPRAVIDEPNRDGLVFNTSSYFEIKGHGEDDDASDVALLTEKWYLDGVERQNFERVHQGLEFGLGNHTIRLVVSDGKNQSFADRKFEIVEPVIIVPNNIPVAVIDHPERDGLVYNTTSYFEVSGHGVDADASDVLTETWYVDGNLQGAGFERIHVGTDFGVGNHTLRLVVSDGKNSSYAERKFEIVEPVIIIVPNNIPVAVIDHPERDGLVYNTTSYFEVSGHGVDADASDVLTETWYVDGNLQGAGFERIHVGTDFGVGNHTLRLVVSDGKNESYAQRTFIIRNIGANNAPIAYMLSPVNGTRIKNNETFVLDGYGFDLDNDPIVETWTIDGTAVSEGTIQASAYSLGNHLVRLTVTDGIASDYVEVSINIYNATVPQTLNPIANVVITTLSQGENGTKILFNGNASHDQDNVGSEPQIVEYRWLIDGRSYTDSSFVFETPATIGKLSYILTVVDNDGEYGTASGEYNFSWVKPITEQDLLELKDANLILPIKFKQVYYANKIRPGSYARIDVSIINDYQANKNVLKDLTIKVSIPRLSVSKQTEEFDLGPQDTKSSSFYLPISSNAKGYFSMRITVTNGEAERVTYRDIYIG